jgi:hypothetical protein
MDGNLNHKHIYKGQLLLEIGTRSITAMILVAFLYYDKYLGTAANPPNEYFYGVMAAYIIEGRNLPNFVLSMISAFKSDKTKKDDKHG